MKRPVMSFLLIGVLGLTVFAQSEQKRIVPPIRGEATIEYIGTLPANNKAINPGGFGLADMLAHYGDVVTGVCT